MNTAIIASLLITLTPNEALIAKKALEWKKSALVCREEKAAIDFKLRLTEESRRRWIAKAGKVEVVKEPYIPMWVPPVVGGATGIAAGTAVGTGAGASIQGALIGGAAGVVAGFVVSLFL